MTAKNSRSTTPPSVEVLLPTQLVVTKRRAKLLALAYVPLKCLLRVTLLTASIISYLYLVVYCLRSCTSCSWVVDALVSPCRAESVIMQFIYSISQFLELLFRSWPLFFLAMAGRGGRSCRSVTPAVRHGHIIIASRRDEVIEPHTANN